MKKTVFIFALTCLTYFSSLAQNKRDGTPDMRYRANKELFSVQGSYTIPRYTIENTTTTYQNGYIKSNGTYEDGHYKTMPNATNIDNYSTAGNLNLYTHEPGSRARDYSPEAYQYGSGRAIQTGSRGGQYYINDHGNKVYVPKRN